MIEVLDGEATVATTTTDENGNYHLELAPGDIRIRASKAGYQPTVIGPFAIATGSRTVRSFRIEPRYVPPSPPAPSPVTRVVRGRVTDVRGNGVASALVTVVDADTRQGFRSVSADATGAFAVSFPVSAERRATALYVTKPGYPRQEVPFECCVNPEPQFIDVTMPMRVASVTLRGPLTIAVAQVVQILALVVFDDNSEALMNPVMLDARGGVQNSLQGSGMIEGARAGSGYVSWSYQGVSAGLTITITP